LFCEKNYHQSSTSKNPRPEVFMTIIPAKSIKPIFCNVSFYLIRKHVDVFFVVLFERSPQQRTRTAVFRSSFIMIPISPQRVVFLRKRVDKIMIPVFHCLQKPCKIQPAMHLRTPRVAPPFICVICCIRHCFQIRFSYTMLL